MRKYIVVFVMLLLFAGPIFAGEAPVVPPDVPVEVPVVAPIFDWFNPVMDGLLQVVLLVLATGLSLLVWWIKAKLKLNETQAQAIDAISVAMQRTYTTYLKTLRKGISDRKLTKDEREEAMRLTIQEAQNITSGPVLEFLKEKGADWIKTKTEHLLISLKAKIFKKEKKKEGATP